MYKLKCRLEGISPYSQSKRVVDVKPENMSYDEWEQRMWPLRLHVLPNGTVYIPPMALKKSIDGAGTFLSEKVKGKGGAKTYTRYLRSGLLITDPIVLPYKVPKLNVKTLESCDLDDLPDLAPITGEAMDCDSSPGKPGKGSRVYRWYPRIPEDWSADVEILVLAEVLNEQILAKHLECAGMFIGLGRFRPQNGGFYGRFKASKLEWQPLET